MTEQELAAIAPARRLATLAPCSCGQWPHDFWTPCALLASITALERRGFCAQCGNRLKQQQAPGYRRVWCPQGHSDKRDWFDPSDPERPRVNPMTPP
jgi:hypothetical protein